MECREQSLFLLQALALRSSAVLCSCARCDSQSPWQARVALLFGFFFYFFIKNSRPQTGRSVWCLPGASAHPWDKQPNISITPVCFQAIPPGSAPRLLQVSHILLLLLQSPGSSLALISPLPGSQVGALPPLLSPCHPRTPRHSWLGRAVLRNAGFWEISPLHLPFNLVLQVLPKSLPAA